MRLQFTNEMFSNKNNNNNKKQEENYRGCDGNINKQQQRKKKPQQMSLTFKPDEKSLSTKIIFVSCHNINSIENLGW